MGHDNNIYALPKMSVGKIITDALKKRSPFEVITIDAVTKQALTTGELLQDSIKLGQLLHNLGIKKGHVVSIATDNDIKFLIMVLAAFNIGATVNPINPGYSIGEMKHILNISKPNLIFCTDKSLPTIMHAKEDLQFAPKLLLMQRRSEEYPEIPTYEELLPKGPINTESFQSEEINYTEDVALILCSSGTTGLPKGVQLTHENLGSSINCLSHPLYANINSEDTTVIIMPCFHVFGIVLQLTAVITSMVSVIMDKFNPKIYLHCIQQHKATKLFIVPALLLFLLRNPLVQNYDISSLKVLHLGGATCGKDLQVEFTQRFGIKVRQGYGMTETCAPVIYQPYDDESYGSVGKLITGAEAKVWNPETKTYLGCMEIGELCFKGPMLMKGYLPMQDHLDKEGFFHTGDVGFYDHEGYFYLVGRTKELIKYKGFQVPPAELEALICTHPCVYDCGVIGVPDERAGEVPLALVVRKDHTEVDEKEIVDFVAERISVQKRLYGGVRFVDEIPKNSSGKILRCRLQEIYNSSLA